MQYIWIGGDNIDHNKKRRWTDQNDLNKDRGGLAGGNRSYSGWNQQVEKRHYNLYIKGKHRQDRNRVAILYEEWLVLKAASKKIYGIRKAEA